MSSGVGIAHIHPRDFQAYCEQSEVLTRQPTLKNNQVKELQPHPLESFITPSLHRKQMTTEHTLNFFQKTCCSQRFGSSEAMYLGLG